MEGVPLMFFLKGRTRGGPIVCLRPQADINQEETKYIAKCKTIEVQWYEENQRQSNHSEKLELVLVPIFNQT